MVVERKSKRTSGTTLHRCIRREYSPSCFQLTLVDYKYGNRKSKSRDASFIPPSIQIPPAKPRPGTTKQGYAGFAYPPVVFEVTHKHESWARLMDDVRHKAFAGSMSIQVFLGLKLYKRHLKFIWARRGRQQRGMKIMRLTPKFPVNGPTHLYLSIPTSLIFGGSCVPQHIRQQHCRFMLEDFRQIILSLH
jgi:hypothetical protein